jgi:hypothetical protein
MVHNGTMKIAATNPSHLSICKCTPKGSFFENVRIMQDFAGSSRAVAAVQRGLLSEKNWWSAMSGR